MNLINSLIKKVQEFYKKLTHKPEGYVEYMRALTHKDETFDFYSNPFFVNYIVPRCKHEHPDLYIKNLHFNKKYRPIASTSEIKNVSPHSNSHHSPFRVNPTTGLPMVGAYDTRGNTFGFSNTFNSQSNYYSSSQPWK